MKGDQGYRDVKGHVQRVFCYNKNLSCLLLKLVCRARKTKFVMSPDPQTLVLFKGFQGFSMCYIYSFPLFISTIKRKDRGESNISKKAGKSRTNSQSMFKKCIKDWDNHDFQMFYRWIGFYCIIFTRITFY